MYCDRDFVPERAALPPNEAALTQDLELETLVEAMSGEEELLRSVTRKALLEGLDRPEAILYRQEVLADCLCHPEVVREMYSIAVEAIEGERKVHSWMLRQYPDSVVRRSVEVLKSFVGPLERLKLLAKRHGSAFPSEGFTRLFGTLVQELPDEYLCAVRDHLRRLSFRDGILMSAELGKSNQGVDYVLRKPRGTKRGLVDRLRSGLGMLVRDRSALVYRIGDRDEAGFRALGELRNRGFAQVAGPVGRSADHVLAFFRMLRTELAFYVGCLNLRERLESKGEPVSFPEPLPAGIPFFSARGLYDVCLSLKVAPRVVGNDVDADEKRLVLITGANQGGKSTFLRSVGLAQLMMQCGMFVPAASFRASVSAGIFTHFKREEDAALTSGKLDEELARMSSLVDAISSTSMVLFNESFASTNEREGSEIARQIVRALTEKGIRVFYVTHLFDLASGFYSAKGSSALFLRAERLADGRRTFRLVEGEPLATSHGEDLYQRIFGPGAVPDVG